MLQKIDEHTKRLLDLADFIEKDVSYHQGNWNTCICGMARKMLGVGIEDYGTSPACHSAWAREALQISDNEARELFSNFANPSREDAARVVRNFALTGHVDWRKANNLNWLWGYMEQRTNGQVDSEVLSRSEPVPVSVS